jgi:hypothetical protein
LPGLRDLQGGRVISQVLRLALLFPTVVSFGATAAFDIHRDSIPAIGMQRGHLEQRLQDEWDKSFYLAASSWPNPTDRWFRLVDNDPKLHDIVVMPLACGWEGCYWVVHEVLESRDKTVHDGETRLFAESSKHRFWRERENKLPWDKRRVAKEPDDLNPIREVFEMAHRGEWHWEEVARD